jgi:hypothetical protein
VAQAEAIQIQDTCLEADRATMPIVRADLNQTSHLRKLLAYLAGGGKTNAFGAHFGVGNFRVLTVTTSAERMAGMITALKELTGGAGSSQFLFVDKAALNACADLLALEWTTGKVSTFVFTTGSDVDRLGQLPRALSTKSQPRNQFGPCFNKCSPLLLLLRSARRLAPRSLLSNSRGEIQCALPTGFALQHFHAAP